MEEWAGYGADPAAVGQLGDSFADAALGDADAFGDFGDVEWMVGLGEFGDDYPHVAG